MNSIPLDYTTLRLIWWVLLGVLLIAFAITDGFDLGIGILLHRVARTDDERRVVINTIGPIWEGNQIWFILGGGAIFAAWPELYAVSFSGFYFAMLLILFALILRPVGFKYRAKINNPTWRAVWDMCLFIGGFFPAFLFGVAVGNVLQGVPFYYDTSLLSFYTGTLLQLLNPFALLCGLLSVSMCAMHGGIFLNIKTSGNIQRRAANYSQLAALATMVIFLVAGYWIANHLQGYVLINGMPTDAPSNPLHKKVGMEVGAWLHNYQQFPRLFLAPLFGVLGAIFAIIFVSLRFPLLAWLGSASSIAAIIITVGVSMFPFILPSSSNPNMSLMVWDASSSQLTLFTMLLASAVFLPIIILYTSWVYYVLRGKVTVDDIKKRHSY
jgi:cytochrome d ubiquinol oxidase subunit II